MDDALQPAEELYADLLELSARSEEANASLERAKANRCIGIVFSSDEVASPAHPLFGPVLAGIRQRALERNNDLCIALPRVGGRTGGVASGVERSVLHAVDGLILLGINGADPELLAAEQSGLPTVFLEYSAIGGRAATVQIDNPEAIAAVVRHLAGLGYSRIGHVAGDLETIEGQERLRGFRREMEKLGLSADLVEPGEFTPQSGYAQMKRLLTRPLAPQAVVAGSDIQAVGALVALHEAGLQCPEDVALTGFDDADFAARVDPPLTTVHQPGRELGSDAIDAINQMLDRPHEPPPIMLRPGELIVRESCGARLRERV